MKIKFKKLSSKLKKNRLKIVVLVAILALVNSLFLIAMISRRGNESVSWMHLLFRSNEDKQEEEEIKPVNMPDRIAETAISLAWPLGTAKKEYSYPRGSATDKYDKALKKVYPDRSRWGKAPKVGASCDVFVGTVVRYSGYDDEMPRGLGNMKRGQWHHLDESNLWQEVPYSFKESDLQHGDIIIYQRYSKSEHICIYVKIKGEGYLAEASIKSTYGHLSKVQSTSKIFKKKDKKKFKVYRAWGSSKELRELGENKVKKDVVR